MRQTGVPLAAKQGEYFRRHGLQNPSEGAAPDVPEKEVLSRNNVLNFGLWYGVIWRL